MPTKDIAKLTEIYFYLFWEVESFLESLHLRYRQS